MISAASGGSTGSGSGKPCTQEAVDRPESKCQDLHLQGNAGTRGKGHENGKRAHESPQLSRHHPEHRRSRWMEPIPRHPRPALPERKCPPHRATWVCGTDRSPDLSAAAKDPNTPDRIVFLGRTRTVAGRLFTQRGRAVLVNVSLVEFYDVALGVGDPAYAHARDELTHIERA